MSANPEDRVIDEIDQLVSEAMAAGLDRYGMIGAQFLA